MWMECATSRQQTTERTAPELENSQHGLACFRCRSCPWRALLWALPSADPSVSGNEKLPPYKRAAQPGSPLLSRKLREKELSERRGKLSCARGSLSGKLHLLSCARRSLSEKLHLVHGLPCGKAHDDPRHSAGNQRSRYLQKLENAWLKKMG